MLRPRLSFNVDENRRLIVIRYIGDIGGEDIVPEMLSRLSGVDKVWEYDSIFDLTRHNALVEMRDHDALAKGWLNMTAGRDAGRRTAVVSLDPLIAARLPLVQAMFPFRTMMLFTSMAAAEAWLGEERDTGEATSAA